MLLMLLASATPAPEAPVIETTLPAWATVALGVIGLISTLGLAYIGYLQQRSHKQAKNNSEAIEEIRATTGSVERKVTSNHGHDNIGDKVDVLVDRVGSMTQLMERVVSITVDQDERIARMESVTTTVAGQSADNAVIAATSFEELNAKLDGLTVIRPPARIIPGPSPRSRPRSQQVCHKASCDGSCGRRHPAT